MSVQSKFMPKGVKMVEFVANNEPWAQYTLEDGTIVRVRIMMVKAMDEGFYAQGEGNPDMEGFPKVNMQFQQVIDVTFPDDVKAASALRKKDNA